MVKQISPIKPVKLNKKRVAAYARVSMDTEELYRSLTAQVSYYSNLIQNNPEWEFKGVFADFGISGTSTVGREELIKLLELCEAGEVDIILVKSISRFARNTVDLLKIVRRLKELGVEVRFEREGINTLADNGELLLTLLASFAQAESDSISQNVKWAVRKGFEEGRQNGYKEPFGYKWDGKLYRLDPEAGSIVKEIFTRYLSGEPIYRIAKSLANRGIRGQSGLPIRESTVKEILSSRSYTGVQELQKYYISGKRKKNKGELPKYLVEGMYEPVISEEEFEAAQRLRAKRAESLPKAKSNPLRGKVKCGICGRSLSRKNKWFCNSQLHGSPNKCDLIPVELGVFDESAETIVVRNDFILTDGKRKTLRTYPRTAFSGKLFLNTKLCRDTWRGRRVWRNGYGRIYEDELRALCLAHLGKNYEQEIAQNVERINVTDKELIIIMKGGEEVLWQRK